MSGYVPTVPGTVGEWENCMAQSYLPVRNSDPLMRCTGSSHDPRAVKVTGTENGTQPGKNQESIPYFPVAFLSLMNTGTRAVRYRARARAARRAIGSELHAGGARTPAQYLRDFAVRPGFRVLGF